MTLQIFEKHPTADAYFFRGSYVPYAIIAVDKRFSDAELAAEYWAAEWEARAMRLTSLAVKLGESAATFLRFAQHAHYDEVTERWHEVIRGRQIGSLSCNLKIVEDLKEGLRRRGLFLCPHKIL